MVRAEFVHQTVSMAGSKTTGPPGPEFEIALTNPDGMAVSRDDGDPARQPTNWRRVVGIASIAGTVLGIVVGVVFVQVGDDDNSSSGTATTLDPDSLATSITTPPTLSPLAELPPTDFVPGTLSTAPQGTTSQTRRPFNQVPVPVFERFEGTPPESLDGYDLDAAIANLSNGAPRHSSTHLELGFQGFVRDYAITHDAQNGRYFVAFGDATGGSTVAILDEPGETLYIDVSAADADPEWITLDPAAEAGLFGVDSLGLLYDHLLAGPIRGDTITTAEVATGDLVFLDDGTSLARSYEVVVDGAAIPEWQIYALGPTREFAPIDRPGRMTFTVYVDGSSEIRRVVGLSDLGGIPQLIVHDIERVAEPFTIDLPDPATVGTPSSPTD